MCGVDVKGGEVSVRKAQQISHLWDFKIESLSFKIVILLLCGNMSKKVDLKLSGQVRCQCLVTEQIRCQSLACGQIGCWHNKGYFLSNKPILIYDYLEISIRHRNFCDHLELIIINRGYSLCGLIIFLLNIQNVFW